ncbi:class I SAM-dependent methyltransferase [Ichthyenterobacterium sp. W332]|uniref:Class I SAM-dependent methyltransferase n=1 Tax=Microcosmobacter mediterraneus TaxID=3075607 RepID=A0ABU2YGM2_9FLAO|nr:class I SAM-dependent methyltransferase [Ichthyenterobacterium sp. W332]MDT0557331.1 class I SAM-dependent methyltransferase [Ichthyenterobacterium sp. W332]
MYQTLAYLKFLIKSTNQHGVHSPFVYDLLTKCFYNTSKNKDYSILQSYKTSLINSNETINVNDLGEGSKTFKTNSRAVSNIAKTSASLDKSMYLMYRIFDYFKPNIALELGTSLGVATNAMALGHTESEITTIEGCPQTSDFTKNSLCKSLNNVNFLSGHFKDVIPTLTQTHFDFIFFDGHHNKAATIDYFEMLLAKATNNSVFIFDDIYWSKGMTKAWNIIKAHPKVTLSIDTFFWGFVFFRQEQPKQHFKIRV